MRSRPFFLTGASPKSPEAGAGAVFESGHLNYGAYTSNSPGSQAVNFGVLDLSLQIVVLSNLYIYVS